MAKRKCPRCGNECEVGVSMLPECPECIRLRFKHPAGVKPKHTPSGAAKSKNFASYIGDGVDGNNLFNYLAYGPHTEPSGCEVFVSKTYGSFNAVAYKPMGDIPGSGIQAGSHFASEYAVLQDIEGKSGDGPHWAFEDPAHLQQRISTGDYTPAPKCSKCGQAYVYKAGDMCFSCQP